MKKEEFLSFSLPYELYCIISGDASYKILSLHFGNINLVRVHNTGYRDFPITIPHVKLILRPIFELEAILLSEFEKYHQNIDCDNEIIELFCEEHIKTNDLISEINIESLPFDTVIWMIKNHFDIAGLIEKGEAIDVNKLPENPYK